MHVTLRESAGGGGGAVPPAPAAELEAVSAPTGPAAGGVGSYRLDVAIHDITRLQWVASAPLTESGERRSYTIEMTLDVPEHLWTQHSLWDAFWVRTRLQSPDHGVRATRPRSLLDDIRHEALRVSRRMKRLERRVERALERGEDGGAELDRLISYVRGRRAAVLHTGQDAAEAIETEARLAAEYLSVSLLSAFARLRDRVPKNTVAAQRLTAAIVTERAYRRAQGWPTPRGDGRKGLERWLCRRSALKKHFHQLLWLDADAYKPEVRLANWIAAFVAVVASTWAFSWQLAYMNELISGGMSLMSMVMAGAVAGVLYAVKDRIKELGRRWIGRRVRDGIADKVVHLHLQKRVDKRRGRLLSSRENLRAVHVYRTDPLNPALGETVSVVALTVSLRLDQHGLRVPGDWGVGGVKHVMRYDLSALLPRLDHGRREVPVTRADGRVHLASVRKLYGLKVRCVLKDEAGGVALCRHGEVLLDRGGLRRLRMAEDDSA